VRGAGRLAGWLPVHGIRGRDSHLHHTGKGSIKPERRVGDIKFEKGGILGKKKEDHISPAFRDREGELPHGVAQEGDLGSQSRSLVKGTFANVRLRVKRRREKRAIALWH